MRSFVLLGMLLCAIPSAADATDIVCRGPIIREWGYLSIMSTEGTECIITRRVGMQTVIDTCGPKRCKVTGVYHDHGGMYQYIEGLISVEIAAEPERLGDPTLSQ
jgi:hypothetical protein